MVEVMMATVITMVGFIGMMEAVTIAATTMDHARRQTFATQVLSHEVNDLYFSTWTTISGLSTSSTAVRIDPQFWPNWSATATYSLNRVVAHGGAFYRCVLAHGNQTPPNSTYWTAVTSAGASDVVVYSGATYTMARTLTSPDPVTNIREVNFTLTWTVVTGRIASGVTQGNRTVAIGADDYATNLRRADSTHTRVMSAWYGKYGLPLSYPQS
jgi:hypothetical protein